MRDYLAVSAATDLDARARDLRSIWDAAFSGVPAAQRVRPVIAQSWSRVAAAGFDPGTLRPRRALDAEGLAAARAASPLRLALPALRRHLGTIADEAEHVVVVCDHDGRILWLEGHPRVLEQARAIDFTPGMLWTEASAGTNAIGTALAIDHPLQVFSAEHFLPDQHTWWCSAAPLHDPLTGDLVGIVNVSGPHRTAHPYSLTLVAAAARIAGDVLQAVRIDRENGLREAFHARTRGRPGTEAALVDDAGRVLAADPAGWVRGRVPPPRAAERVVLASGDTAEAEGIDGGWVLWRAPAAGRRAAGTTRPSLRLQVLGRHGHTVAVDAGAPQALTPRHAEALALIALHPEGLSAEQLTLQLYGETGKTVTTRALLSRLRDLLGGTLEARPYRLHADVRADFLAVRALLASGDSVRALGLYRGPLLVESEVEEIVAVRTELAAAVRQAALDGDAESVWWWLEHEDGREDVDAMRVFLRIADGRDLRREVVVSRLETLLGEAS